MTYRQLQLFIAERCLHVAEISGIAEKVNEIASSMVVSYNLPLDVDPLGGDTRLCDNWILAIAANLGLTQTEVQDATSFNLPTISDQLLYDLRQVSHSMTLNWLVQSYDLSQNGLSYQWEEYFLKVTLSGPNQLLSPAVTSGPPGHLYKHFTVKADTIIIFWGSHGLTVNALNVFLGCRCHLSWTNNDHIRDRRVDLRIRQKRARGYQDFVQGDDGGFYMGMNWNRNVVDAWVREQISHMSTEDAFEATLLKLPVRQDSLVLRLSTIQLRWNISALSQILNPLSDASPSVISTIDNIVINSLNSIRWLPNRCSHPRKRFAWYGGNPAECNTSIL